jgi:hypothetical protein
MVPDCTQSDCDAVNTEAACSAPRSALLLQPCRASWLQCCSRSWYSPASSTCTQAAARRGGHTHNCVMPCCIRRQVMVTGCIIHNFVHACLYGSSCAGCTCQHKEAQKTTEYKPRKSANAIQRCRLLSFGCGQDVPQGLHHSRAAHQMNSVRFQHPLT